MSVFQYHPGRRAGFPPPCGEGVRVGVFSPDISTLAPPQPYAFTKHSVALMVSPSNHEGVAQ